ncbi:hypothetical protein D3C72_2595250 [compost metagenome]
MLLLLVQRQVEARAATADVGGGADHVLIVLDQRLQLAYLGLGGLVAGALR